MLAVNIGSSGVGSLVLCVNISSLVVHVSAPKFLSEVGSILDLSISSMSPAFAMVKSTSDTGKNSHQDPTDAAVAVNEHSLEEWSCGVYELAS